VNPDGGRADGEARGDEAQGDEAQGDEARGATMRPDRAQPDRAQPDRAQPDRAQPDRAQPDRAQPDRAQPDRALSKGGDGALAGVRFGRVLGIELVADWSLLVIFALLVVNLGLGVFPSWHPRWSGALVWSTAIGAAALFFGSILLHELAHALVGRALGIPVRRITLFMLGGMAHLEGEPPSPKAELLMAAAGPLTSLVIGLAATATAALLLDGTQLDEPVAMVAALGPLGTLLAWLGPVNLMLGAFNLVPGFPLDGGRVLRALLWAGTKDLAKATRWASWGGQVVGWAIVAWGVASLFSGRWGQGLWLMLIGGFLTSAARASYRQTLAELALRGTRVAELMRRSLDAVSPELSVGALVAEHVMTTDQQCFPVVSGTHLEGLVCVHDVRRVPREAWAETLVVDVMTPSEELETVAPEQPATEALRKLAERDVDQVPVVDDEGSLLGLVRRQDILRWLSLRSSAPA
jgi:Zn-dependent protease